MAGLEAAHKVCNTMVVTRPCVVSHSMEAAFITRTDMAFLLLREGRYSRPLRLLGVDLMPPGLEALSMPRSPPTCRRGLGREVGAGQRGGTATNQVTEMAVDSSSTKLPLAVNSSVTPTDQQVELEKFRPDKNHKWDIQTTGTGAFIINFPSADLLNQVVNWGPMSAKGVQGKIQFEKGTENEVNKWEIEKVWVQFRGLPSEFKEFPIIWAVGTILGVPRAVDTIFTKNTGRPRMKVAVLDPKLIPTYVDVVIGDFIYELQFAVEVESPTGEPQLVDMDSTNEEDPKEDDPKNSEHPKGENAEEHMDVDGKTTQSKTSAKGGEESQTADIPQVSDLENELLTAPFTEEEVRTAIFQLEHNKAPGPDGTLQRNSLAAPMGELAAA
uniref:DUF4283 domain-containing protein n=1 Tax=Sorghum bicolor TaxID=4558 RepID=C6JRR7_SORBI